MKDKAIVRKIKAGPFLEWRGLYENYALWQIHGFDYIPIEQIHSYRLNEEGLIEVFGGVLDLNLKEWSEITDRFLKKLEDQRDKIIKVLKEQKTEHGHDHDKNFCLRFFRDENGKPDLKRMPRLYLIDFDQAVSP